MSAGSRSGVTDSAFADPLSRLPMQDLPLSMQLVPLLLQPVARLPATISRPTGSTRGASASCSAIRWVTLIRENQLFGASARCKTLIFNGTGWPMENKFLTGTTAVLAALLISGCVKQHAKWHEVPLTPSFPFPYVSPTAHPEPRPGNQLTPNQSLGTSPITPTGPASSYNGTSYSRSSGGSSGFGGGNSGGGYSGGSYLSRGARVTLAITLLFLIFVAPWLWFLYPSWKRARKSNGPVTPAAPPPQAPQIPTRETWDALGLCPDCGSRMVARVAKRGRHKGKSFYGCSKFPRCTGIRQTIPDQLPAAASKSGALDGTVSPGSHQ
ncbi:topoisomerase DNA-binding C4 zinc finger domain-containing protein [Pseudomonas sp. K1(2024)]|uniref:Topoisomerase DNA-binding C4 zinc finger domain-containing protein n=1 Tax=Pseudomonas boreofloridensis TaxID=3064348 RepID=A0ABV4ZAS0_9PSED